MSKQVPSPETRGDKRSLNVQRQWDHVTVKTGLSPILKVDQDCLLTIFDIITSQIPEYKQDTNRPLVVIRAASQVCQRWRQLLIQSPWIWGRVVDMGVEIHGPRRIEWLDEVLRRAGGSVPLWVTGKVVVNPRTVPAQAQFDSQAFFLRVFESLERIERVSIVIVGERIPSTITSRFFSRAPILKTFNIKFAGHFNLISLTGNTSPSASGLLEERLFSDHAPSLKDIRLDNVAIRMDSPWLSRIRNFSLHTTTTAPISFQDMVVLLQHTPCLQRFTIFGAFPSNTGSSRYSNNFNADPPTLSHIQINSSPRTASKILTYIKHHKLSFFRLGVHDLGHQEILVRDPDVLQTFAKYLPSFISSYFTSNASTKVRFRLGRHVFNFSDLTKPIASAPLDGGPTFLIFFHYNLQEHVDQDAVMTCLMGAFVESSMLSRNPCHYRSITEIAIVLEQIRSNTFPTLYSMLTMFENVQSMTTDDDSCKNLLDLAHHGEAPGSAPDSQHHRHHHHHVLFPKLHTLCATNWPKYDPNTFKGFIEFLKHRKTIGFPVSTLDLTTFPSKPRLRQVNDLTALEDVGGLEVIWKKLSAGSFKEAGAEEICSYVCGSGDPQQLKILF